MDLSNLEKIVIKKKRRLGQGHGSGRVKTAGRGTKGQKARSTIALDFEGSSHRGSLLKRLPMMRGKLRNRSHDVNPVIINVSRLNKLSKNSVVDAETLVRYKLVDDKEGKIRGVKVLGGGDLQIPLTVKVPVSKSAAEKITKAGGTVV